jgi:hypothetical protein
LLPGPTADAVAFWRCGGRGSREFRGADVGCAIRCGAGKIEVGGRERDSGYVGKQGTEQVQATVLRVCWCPLRVRDAKAAAKAAAMVAAAATTISAIMGSR